MEYLEAFKEYLETGNSSRTVPFNPELRQALLQTYQDTAGKGWPLQFEILPGTRETKSNRAHDTLIKYTGKFIYGFYKNGLYYEYPGDDAATTNVKPIDDGQVVFIMNLEGQITTIYETFTGNTYGKQILGLGNKSMKRLFTFLIIAFVLMFLLKFF